LPLGRVTEQIIFTLPQLCTYFAPSGEVEKTYIIKGREGKGGEEKWRKPEKY
jgi:hypothetical protein